ncbi:MAG: hypothetical protein K2P81_10490 [Bacteriovoracaceae bacterium]|nr:hypothetical protein [Bacteriovoracaceae bacterium]
MDWKSAAFAAFIITTDAVADWKYSGNVAPYFNGLNFGTSHNVPTQKAGLQTEHRLEKKINSQLKFKSDIWIRTDYNARDEVERFQWNIKNLYLQSKYKTMALKLGYQTMQTDGPDIINPADIVHSKNWVDPTNPVSLGSAGLSLAQEKNAWSWEILYIPSQTKPVLPGAHSPWLPRENRLPIESQNLELRIPNDVTYRYLSAEEINHATRNNVAAKIARKTENLEMQLVYYNGLAQSPFLLTEVNASLISLSPKQVLMVDGPVKLKPLYYRQQAMAATFLIPFESWAIKGGANIQKPETNDSRVPKETYTGVIGLEKSVETPIGLITGVIEHVRQKKLNENQISFLRSLFEEAWTAGVRIPWGEETTFMLGGVYDQVGGSSIYKFNVNRRLSTSLTMDFGTQHIQGPQKTLLGIYQKYDSAQFKLVYSW